MTEYGLAKDIIITISDARNILSYYQTERLKAENDLAVERAKASVRKGRKREMPEPSEDEILKRVRFDWTPYSFLSTLAKVDLYIEAFQNKEVSGVIGNLTILRDRLADIYTKFYERDTFGETVDFDSQLAEEKEQQKIYDPLPFSEANQLERVLKS